MTNSTPLLSTIVQAGATLVAIIAGLLTARLVALVSERNALERRTNELAALRAERAKDFSDASRALLDEDASNFIDYILDDYFDQERSYDDLYSQYLEYYQDNARSSEEMRPYFDNFVAQVNAVGVRLDVENLRHSRPPNWTSVRGRLVEQFSHGFEKRIADKLLDSAEAQWRRRRPAQFGDIESMVARIGGFPLVSPELRAATLTVESANYRDLVRREAAAKAGLREAELELAHARRALLVASRPEGLWATVTVLVCIAVAGVALPLLQMTFGSTSLSTTARAVFVGAFLASLVAFFVYLGLELRRIMRRPSSS